jgi:hypothetical protein
MDGVEKLVLTPGEAAERLGIGVPQLVDIIRRGRYAFIELRPGGKPGDRGRGRWGLTHKQLDAILRGMERRLPDLSPPEAAGRAAPSPESPDGKSRLRAARGRGSDCAGDYLRCQGTPRAAVALVRLIPGRTIRWPTRTEQRNTATGRSR